MQSETKSRVDQITSPAGHPVSVLRFEGDIASTSKEAVLGTYQSLPKQSTKLEFHFHVDVPSSYDSSGT